MRRLDSFLRSRDGAVTVDWVVLTGAMVVLVVAATVPASGSIADVAVTIATLVRDSVNSLLGKG